MQTDKERSNIVLKCELYYFNLYFITTWANIIVNCLNTVLVSCMM